MELIVERSAVIYFFALILLFTIQPININTVVDLLLLVAAILSIICLVYFVGVDAKMVNRRGWENNKK